MTKEILASGLKQGNVKIPSRESLRLFVVETGPCSTPAAIRAAGALARGLNAEVTLLAAVEVPSPLDLQEPPVSIGFLENRLREMAERAETPVRVELRLCRDHREAIRRALPAGALVVIAGPAGWFHRATRRFAAILAKDGHKVFWIEE